MAEIRLEDLNLENVGVIADLPNLVLSDEEDDDNDSYKKELDDELNKKRISSKDTLCHQLMKMKNSGKMLLTGLGIIAD